MSPQKCWVKGAKAEAGTPCVRRGVGRGMMEPHRVEGACQRAHLAPDERWVSRTFRPDRDYREWGMAN